MSNEYWLVEPPLATASEEDWLEWVEDQIANEVPEEFWEWMVPDDIFQPDEPKGLGGKGSGNFGHAGRPGQIGGSGGGSGGDKNDEILKRPASYYKPSHPEGNDTKAQFSDGHRNYSPERTELHEAIIAKYLKGTTPVDKPIAIVLGGAPGVGKSTIVKANGIGKENTVIVSVDDIRNDLPEYAPDAEGKRPASIAFTHEEASDIGAKLINRASESKRNTVLDGTGDSSIEKLGGKAAVMRSQGATVEAVYVTTTVEEAQRRSDNRGLKIGRMVPPTAMREMHGAISRVFPEAVRQGLFDNGKLFDSTEREPVLVASSKGKELTIHNQVLWDRFIAKGKR